jgi:hypothetical protein
MEQALTATNGIPGTRRDVVEFDGNTVTIKRGLLGSAVTTIPVSRMTSVGWKKSLTGRGHIEFIAAGMDGKIEFNGWWVKQFEAMHNAVEAALST